MRVHTLSMFASICSGKWLRSAAQHISLMFCCRRYLLTKTRENRNKSGGFNSNHFILDHVHSSFTDAGCVWTTGFHQQRAASPPAKPQTKDPPHLISAQQVQVLAPAHWSAEQTHLTAHVLFKSFSSPICEASCQTLAARSSPCFDAW